MEQTLDVAGPNLVRSAVKVLDTFRLLCHADGPVLASTIADQLGISAPTAFRAAETLVACGFARRSLSGHGYLPSLDVVEMAGSIVDHLGIKAVAREVLVDVARTFGETITLAVRDGDDAIFIDRVEGSRDLRFYCDVGRRLPLHAGAGPRCLLAHLSQSEFRSYIERDDLEQLTENTRISASELERDRRETRRQGYAVSIDEVDIGVAAVGVPILTPGRSAIAAIAVANLTVRWGADELRARTRVMREAANRIQTLCWSNHVQVEEVR